MVLTFATKRRGIYKEKDDEDEIAGQTKKRRPKTNYINVFEEDVAVVGVAEEDTRNRKKWKRMTHCGDP